MNRCGHLRGSKNTEELGESSPWGFGHQVGGQGFPAKSMALAWGGKTEPGLKNLWHLLTRLLVPLDGVSEEGGQRLGMGVRQTHTDTYLTVVGTVPDRHVLYRTHRTEAKYCILLIRWRKYSSHRRSTTSGEFFQLQKRGRSWHNCETWHGSKSWGHFLDTSGVSALEQL